MIAQVYLPVVRALSSDVKWPVAGWRTARVTGFTNPRWNASRNENDVGLNGRFNSKASGTLVVIKPTELNQYICHRDPKVRTMNAVVFIALERIVSKI